ncbi:MAG: Two component transcriptional regulator, LuxR family [Pedosphaera sp.]|nr:Two component transcriptional regulator, LuxR family [Pedosphaera sp.]
MITVSIVDDNQKLRESITTFLKGTPEFRCISAYGSAAEALKHLPVEKPDVILMDINMAGMDGIECAARLKAETPEMQIVMLTVYEDTDKIFRALSAGANGYILKRAEPAKLLEAIRDVHAGGSAMSSSIARKVVASFQKSAPASPTEAHLSPREQNVLDCLAKGMTYKAIACDLGISIETIRTHLKRVYQKLHVQSRTEAVVKYMRR